MSDADRPGGPEPRGPQYRPGPSGHPQGYGAAGAPGPHPSPEQPYGPQPGQPHGPQPGHPYGLPPRPPLGSGPDRPDGGGRSRVPLVLIGAGVAFLLLVAVVVAAFTAGDDQPLAKGAGGAGAPGSATASDAVQGYLDALAANDAATALSYLDQRPADTTFLTDEVLRVSAEEGAITDIDVPAVTDRYAYTVHATYRLGEEAVSEDFTVTEQGGAYRLNRGVTEYDLGYQRDETLPMLVNGVEVTSDQVSLFPGTYTFTTDSRWVTYEDAQLVLTGPSDYDTPRLTPAITAAGRKAFVAQTRRAFEACLDKRELKPSGCPNKLQLSDGQEVEKGTIRWSVTNDPFRNLKVTLSSADPTVAEARVTPTYNFRADGRQDGRSVTFDGAPFGLFSFSSTGDLTGSTITVKLGG